MQNQATHSAASSPDARKITEPTTTTPWIDRLGLAKFFKVSIRTVDGWKAENRVPFRKVGRRVLFNLDLVEASLAVFDVNAKRVR